MTLADPEPISIPITCTSSHRSVWRLGSGDKAAGDICGNKRRTFNRTRDDNECIAEETCGLRRRSCITRKSVCEDGSEMESSLAHLQVL